MAVQRTYVGSTVYKHCKSKRISICNHVQPLKSYVYSKSGLIEYNFNGSLFEKSVQVWHSLQENQHLRRKICATLGCGNQIVREHSLILTCSCSVHPQICTDCIKITGRKLKFKWCDQIL